MDYHELALSLHRTAETSATKVLACCCSPLAAITKSQAYRLYGRSDVDRWLAEGLICLIRGKGKIAKNCIDKAALERIASKSNRTTYLPVANR